MSYAASVWALKCMTDGHHRGRANSAQRNPLRGITGAYNTTSTMALQVLAGVPPFDLELLQLVRIEKDRNGAMTMEIVEARKVQYKNNLLDLWQSKWVASDKGRWTAKWFPNVRRRMDRVWCKMDHYTTQLMPGHRKSYQCGSLNGTAEHLLME